MRTSIIVISKNKDFSKFGQMIDCEKANFGHKTENKKDIVKYIKNRLVDVFFHLLFEFLDKFPILLVFQ
jgi:hypothetical protein